VNKNVLLVIMLSAHFAYGQAPASGAQTSNLGIRLAAEFAGPDCGAKIMTADRALASNSGEIWVDNSCGTTWTTAVNLSAGHVLRFVQGGLYVTRSGVTLSGATSGIVGPPTAVAIGGTSRQASVTLMAATGSNLPAVLTMGPGYGVVADNIAVDGNKANGGTSSTGVAIKVDRSNRYELRHVTGQNAKSHGLWVHSTGTNNEACCGKISSSFFISNGGDGGYLETTADTFVVQSEFEGNSNHGLESRDSPTARISNSDFGGNQDGIHIVSTGLALWLGASGWILTGNQFGGNYRHDFYANGSAGRWTNVAHVLTGNFFLGGGQADNIYDTIHLEDSGNLTITGNFFGGGGAHRYRYRIFEGDSGYAAPSTIIGNVFNAGGSASGLYKVLANTAVAANSEANAGTWLLQGAALANGTSLLWKDSTGIPRGILSMDTTNTVAVQGHPARRVLSFQPLPGSEVMSVTESGISLAPEKTATFPGGVLAPTWQTNLHTPTNSSSSCSTGQVWADADYVYVCTAANKIKRAALASF
jgi:hypothetical protein